MGYDYDELFPGRFMKAGQFKGRDVTLTIAGVRIEELPQEKGGDRARGIIAFRATKLELVLNRTNGECLKAMFGRQTDAWLGRKVTLYPATISAFGDDKTVAIRVRGSPELDRDMQIEVHLPRKKPIRLTMKRTAPASGKAAAPKEPEPTPEEAPLEEPNPDTGEVPFGN